MGALLAIGGNVGEGLVVAGAIQTATTRQTFEGSPPPSREASATVGQLGVLVDWFPDATGGWHVGGLAGLGTVQITDADVPTSSGASFGGALFGGYDFWIGPQWSLGIFGAGSGTTSAELRQRDGDKVGYTLSGWSASLGTSFTLH